MLCKSSTTQYKFSITSVKLLTYFSQHRLGYSNLTGVDYCDAAVMLARSVSKTEGFEDITYEVQKKILNLNSYVSIVHIKQTCFLSSFPVGSSVCIVLLPTVFISNKLYVILF